MSAQDGRLEPGEAVGIGAALGMTLYGFVVVAASLFAGKELVPEELPLVAGLLIATAAVGAVLGAGLSRIRS
jgi:hypothetical protein